MQKHIIFGKQTSYMPEINMFQEDAHQVTSIIEEEVESDHEEQKEASWEDMYEDNQRLKD